MARRRSKPVLEWVTTVTDVDPVVNTVQRTVINLNLDDDEIAEIHKVNSLHVLQVNDFAVGRVYSGALLLSMDPTVTTSASPSAEASLEDLETFYWHEFRAINEVLTSGMAALKKSDDKQMDFNPPLILATNPAILALAAGSDDQAVRMQATLYFTRRRATDFELARTLLKRR